MQGLLKNAWLGWMNYTTHGKFAVLLLLVLLFLWFRREECKEKLFLVYTTIVAACCIFPVTAAVLMKYQTGFYDYEWIWSYVPVTAMIAYGVVIFLQEQWEYSKRDGGHRKERNKYYIPVLALLVLAVVVLCGGKGSTVVAGEYSLEARERAGEVLASLEEALAEELPDASKDGALTTEICLWAPKEIMAAARGKSADFSLIYGRNMWEAALGAYSYETYGATEEALYLWMCNAEETGAVVYTAEDGSVIDGGWCLQAAEAAGVNVVLLPGTIPAEELNKLLAQTGHAARQLEGYYLLIL